MRSLLLLLCCFPLLLSAQRKRYRHKPPPHHFNPSGTWLVKKRKVAWDGDTSVSTDAVRKTYFRFGDSISREVNMMSFQYETVPGFDRTIVEYSEFLDTNGGYRCWLDPGYFQWSGHYCPYEGYGGSWNIHWVSDTTMIFSCDYERDGKTAGYDSLWLEKVSNTSATIIAKNENLRGRWTAEKGVWFYPDSIHPMPMKYLRALEMDVNDSTFIQRWRWLSPYSKDSAALPGSIEMDYHEENFMGNKLLVSNDHLVYICVVPVDSDSCWIIITSDCHERVYTGTYLFRRQP